MFTQMTIDEEDLIKRAGKLSLKVNPFVDSSKDRDSMEHVIIYCNKEIDCYPESIFRCAVTYGVKCLMIEDLSLRTKGVSPLSEAALHLFLGWVIKDASKWANNIGKEHVFVQTSLPHCTEWFLEYNYDIRPLKCGYSGLKTGDF
jgi:hypothetical protein